MSVRAIGVLGQARHLCRLTGSMRQCRRPALGALSRAVDSQRSPAVYFFPGFQLRCFATETEAKSGNVVDKHEFQAETRQLLDIVARSLYSDHEVFVRELISNASDALEKFRYTLLSSGEADLAGKDRPLEIRITTDKPLMQLTIQDTGIGMTKEELISNLGTIARSGSKQFLEQMKSSQKGASSEASSNIIGQFGVGFYSAFIVANKVEVYTRAAVPNAPGLRWSTDGSGSYEIEESSEAELGTKIVLHLKTDCREYADEDRIKAVIKKYSNFVGSPILLNGKQANEIKPLWLLDPQSISKEQHHDFYRFISNSFDIPRFTLHYKADVPLSIHALLYFPEGKPGLFEMSRDGNTGVALYTRKVLIQSKTEHLLPKWLRFVKGVVDSEDIPLNLSRELLQNSSLIRKLSSVISTRVIRFLQERAKKQPEEYEAFYQDYGLFLKEGIVTSNDPTEKEEVAKLLRFDSSKSDTPSGRMSLEEYYKTVPAEQQNIYYLAAPNRVLAESSPYYESLKKRNELVLFCYEPYDELVLMQLGKFKSKKLVSVEKEMREESKDVNATTDFGEGSLLHSELDSLIPWLEGELKGQVAKVKATSRLDTHPCVITVEEMAAARHFIRTQSHQVPEQNRFALLQPELEINPKHPIIKKLNKLRESDQELAQLIAKQLFANAMVGAGLAEDPRMLLTNMNTLLTRALEKY
ncbi:heat shock protein 75 kDa, mitochondrial isoform X1 [Drosophila bipectinata]|uniref:heat shock protein 75 kDa, mitochondrial isoform X1 n=1 Tax=Drosophila bipectinata TaxID=42026 RepID=UPI001C896AE3|nr:heat shock protein 75 kDa, mitochondrial isoform X1 [Drosophila bipectinata]